MYKHLIKIAKKRIIYLFQINIQAILINQWIFIINILAIFIDIIDLLAQSAVLSQNNKLNGSYLKQNEQLTQFQAKIQKYAIKQITKRKEFFYIDKITMNIFHHMIRKRIKLQQLQLVRRFRLIPDNQLSSINSNKNYNALIYNLISQKAKKKNYIKSLTNNRSIKKRFIKRFKNRMSQFCDQSADSTNKEDSYQQSTILNLFQNAFQNKQSLVIYENNKFILNLMQFNDKIKNGNLLWFVTMRGTQLFIKITLEFLKIRKEVQKKLAQFLNKQFRMLKICYKKPEMSINIKINLVDKHNLLKFFEKQIKQIISNLSLVIQRIKCIQIEQQKLKQFEDLYKMRQCFQFNRSSRNKSTNINLITKRNKNVTQIFKLLGEGSITINKLAGYFIERDDIKFTHQKSQIIRLLEENAKNINKNIQKSILISIQIQNFQNQVIINLQNDKQNALSIISKGLCTYKKQITIHKDLQLQNQSKQLYKQLLIKKQKTQKGQNQFINQTNFLTYMKGSSYEYIADYFCKYEEKPFLSDVIYCKYYEQSLNSIRNKLPTEKKLKILHQISKFLNFLNYRKICHRDLKLDNILIDKQMNVKVIDWGSTCSMYISENQKGNLYVKDQRLFSTEGYFQRYYEEIYHQEFGKKYTRQQIQKGEYFDVYSFGMIIKKVFDNSLYPQRDWLLNQIEYLIYKCRQKNPCDRLTTIQIQIYLAMLRKKLKKLTNEAVSSPSSSSS